MNKHNIKDERVLTLKRKIASEVCSLLLIMILISMLVKKYILNLTFDYYATEFICFWSAVLYSLVRNLILGNSLYPLGLDKKKIFGYSTLAGIAISVTIILLSGETSLALWLIYFIIAALSSFSILLMLNYLNKKRQEQIDNLLNKEENIND